MATGKGCMASGFYSAIKLKEGRTDDETQNSCHEILQHIAITGM
jgi:hypothetical protein